MARMIPSLISPEVKSNAERKIFEWFRDDPETEGWVVLHSLGIANHKTLLYGEVDFIVVAPKLGVFALEVKGGRVKRENGIWHFTNKYGQTASKERGPFEQANEGIFSLFETVRKKCGTNHKFNNLLFGAGVMFPDIIFQVEDFDFDQCQVFDINDGRNVSAYIKRLSKYYRKKWGEKYGPMKPEKLPDTKTVREFANMLRGDFDKAILISTQINYTEEALVSLTGEQMKCLDQLEDNPRCLIQGAAGTGKTLIAIEEVKKSVVNGEKVALFCFNTMLAEWLKRYFSSLDKGLQPEYIGSFHSFLRYMASLANMKINYPNTEDDSDFYRKEMPLIALESLEKKQIYFDKIVIDEAQDLLNSDYLDVIDSILKGGINRGRWSMFGDFTMQAIYNKEETPEYMINLLENRTSFIRYKLRINCRNTKQIGNEIKYLTGVKYNYFETNIDGPPVNYITYNTAEEQKNKLSNLILKLKSEKLEESKIVILSPYKFQNSVVSLLTGFKIEEYRPEITGRITFSTIQAYKGLENSVVIICDINTFEHDKLMYVALSRARTALYVFETEKADKERKKLLMRCYSE